MLAVPKSIRNQRRLAVSLAMTAGYVDGFGLLQFKTYLSFMSGNTTQTGANIGRADFPLAVPSAIAIGSFVVGLVLGNLWKTSDRRDVATIARVGIVLIAVCVGVHFNLISIFPAIAFVAMAMGALNTTLSRVGNEPVNLAFVTGGLSKLGRHLALAAKRVPLEDAEGPWDTRLGRALLLTAVWAAFLVGAILAGFATSRLVEWTLLPAAGFLSLVAVILGFSNRGASPQRGVHGTT